MDDLSAVSLILILAVLLILDAIVYGFGTAVRMLRPQAEEDENEEGSEQGASREREQKLRARRQKILSSVMRNQADYADTIQLVTACVNMVVGAVYGIAVSRFLLVRMEQFFPSGLQEGWAYALSLILSCADDRCSSFDKNRQRNGKGNFVSVRHSENAGSGRCDGGRDPLDAE